MLRIMVLADAPWANSGYSKMAAGLVRRMQNEHAFAWTCIGGLSGGVIDWGDIKLYPRGADAWSQDAAVNNCFAHNADILLSFKDVWLLSQLASAPVFWCPQVAIDHRNVSPHIYHKLHTTFRPIAISKFGQIELNNHEIASTFIPHSVDTNLYKPLEEPPKEKIKEKFNIPAGSFVIGMVAMNRTRKCIARQIRGYKRFLENNPDAKDAKMFLWTDLSPIGDPMSIDLNPLIRQMDLARDVYYPSKDWYERGLEELQMPLLYNTFDVLSNCSSEGAGLPILEAGSCGVPQLVLNYAAGPEYWTSGYVVKCADIEYWASPGCAWGLMDVDDYAEKLAKVYNGDPERFKRRALRAIKPFSWDSVMERYWRPFFEEIETEVRPLVTRSGIRSWEFVQR